MERIIYTPPMTLHLMKENILANDPFCLVDVGASSGIDKLWNVFGASFKAFAFEPLIAECERLNADKNKHPNVTYYPYLIEAEDPLVHAESGPPSVATGNVFARTSASRANDIRNMSYIQEYFNHGDPVVCTEEKISLDKFFLNHPVETIDFIKIDTDGHDYEVIHGARSLFQNKQVLGITIESQFHGKHHPHSNLFRNIDRLLIEAGFSLFDLEVYRYTRKSMPGVFCYDLPAQTKMGQVLWGEALYLRDYAVPNASSKEFNLPLIKIVKLAMLFEIFGLSDCAAELLLTHKDQLSSLIDIQKCLDLLVKNMGSQKSYQEYVKSFETDVANFFPSKMSKLGLSMENGQRFSAKQLFSEVIKKLFKAAPRR